MRSQSRSSSTQQLRRVSLRIRTLQMMMLYQPSIQIRPTNNCTHFQTVAKDLWFASYLQVVARIHCTVNEGDSGEWVRVRLDQTQKQQQSFALSSSPPRIVGRSAADSVSRVGFPGKLVSLDLAFRLSECGVWLSRFMGKSLHNPTGWSISQYPRPTQYNIILEIVRFTSGKDLMNYPQIVVVAQI